MNLSEDFHQLARSLIAHYMMDPVLTDREIGHLFTPELFGPLKPIATTIQGMKEKGILKECSVTALEQSCDPVAVQNIYKFSSTAFSPKFCMDRMLAEVAAKANIKARVEKGKAPRTLDDAQLARRAGEALQRLQRGIERLQTGYPELDRALGGGFAVPSIVVLGAKPKCGKSTIIATIADNVVAAGGYAYILDLENGLDRFVRRLMCRRARIDPEVLSRDSFIPPEPWKITEKMVLESPFGRRFFVDDQRRIASRSLEKNIAELSERAKREGVPFLVVLDSLQKLPMENLSDRRAGIDRWMRWLEGIRDAYRATVILTSELKRPQQGQEYKTNEVSLKESGDIEYTADVVLSLDRHVRDDEYAAEDGALAPPATMRIVFNRDGRTGIVADYRLVHPFHDVEEIPRRRLFVAKDSGNVVPFRG